MKSFFKNLVVFYRIFFSPFLGGQCRFEPTCSAYALEALERYPLGTALAKTAKRLCSCHPFHPGGLDPA
ncbi:MAG TPA: membrane protein insertion efficiency factor YidD [bacterium]|nr:membrane protein insertion efficiency factor YidD [bacterium]